MGFRRRQQDIHAAPTLPERPSRSGRAGPLGRALPRTRPRTWAVMALLALAPPVTACHGSSPCGADAAATDNGLPPVARIRFQLTVPTDDEDYPYTTAAPPPAGPLPGSTVYLSAEGSFDPEGGPVSYFWNVQDPKGAYLSIVPAPEAPRVSFTATKLGPHAITLEVVEGGALGQIGRTTISLVFAPHPCAADGVSPPCSDDLAVPGGTFVAGAAAGMGSDNERPAHQATLAPFALDAYEVTVGRFRRFLAAYTGAPPADGAGAHPLIDGSGWQSTWNDQMPRSADGFNTAIASCGGTWTQNVGANEARPISCVSWYEAFAFCASEGKRLPTEAEWEYAAAGGSEQRLYPWGDDAPTSDLAVFGCLYDGDPSCDDTADLPVAGSLPRGAGRWGQLDLGGSLWEWVFDAYAPYTDAPCDNCAAVTPPPEGGRVFRGSDFRYPDPSWLTVTTRLGIVAALPDDARGLRCARSLP